MKIYHIVAFSDEGNVIGVEGRIPWHLPDDMKRFAVLTKGHPIIMGRKTFDSLGRKALPGRTNIVITRHPEGLPKDPSVIVVEDVGAALAMCKGDPEVYIIGGGQVYRDTMGIVDEIRATIVHDYMVDITSCVVEYPEIPEAEWVMSFVETHETHTYIDYVRRTHTGI